MDWNKAKIYLIISLAFVNIILIWSIQFAPFSPAAIFSTEEKRFEKNPEELAEIIRKKNLEISPDVALSKVEVYDINVKFRKFDIADIAKKLLVNPKKKKEGVFTSHTLKTGANRGKADNDKKAGEEYVVESADDGFAVYFHKKGDTYLETLKDPEWKFAGAPHIYEKKILDAVSDIGDFRDSLKLERYANTKEGEVLLFNIIKEGIVLESGQLIACISNEGYISFIISDPQISKITSKKRNSSYASSAVMKLFMKIDKMKEPTVITGVSLVYRLSISSDDTDEDLAGRTVSGDALPFWRIYTSSGKVYYIEAI